MVNAFWWTSVCVASLVYHLLAFLLDIFVFNCFLLFFRTLANLQDQWLLPFSVYIVSPQANSSTYREICAAACTALPPGNLFLCYCLSRPPLYSATLWADLSSSFSKSYFYMVIHVNWGKGGINHNGSHKDQVYLLMKLNSCPLVLAAQIFSDYTISTLFWLLLGFLNLMSW
jgi:hypothetical protein